MWGGVAIFVVFSPSWCFSIEAEYIAANHPMPIKQTKKACIRSFEVSHEVSHHFFCTFCKSNMFPKIWFTISQKKTWDMKLNFCIWLEATKGLNISWLLQVGVLKYAWTCPNWQQIVSQFYLKNELSYEVSSFHVVRRT